MQKYPRGYQNNIHSDPRMTVPSIFDPALRHFPYGYRLGEPVFPDDEVAQKWLRARWQVIYHLLELVSASRWYQHLVLRGSLLLKAWLGGAAREPGDIDWVFQPKEVEVKNPLSKELFNELIIMVSQHPQVGDLRIQTDKISIDDIWTYERAEGRRIVFPWQVGDLPAGTLQMDIVFGEELFDPPIQTSIPTIEGKSPLVWSASKELSSST